MYLLAIICSCAPTPVIFQSKVGGRFDLFGPGQIKRVSSLELVYLYV